MTYRLALGTVLLAVSVSPAAAQEKAPCTATPAVLQAAAFGTDSLDKPARFLKGSEPKYPAAERMAKIEGKVVLSFVVGIDGTIDQCSLLVVDATDSAFVSSAVAMILSSKFSVGVYKGSPVPSVVTQNVNFQIGGKKRPSR